MKVIDRNSQNVCKKLTCALQEKCVSYNDSDPWEKHFFILNKSQKKLKVLISNTSWILNPNEVISVHKFCLFSPILLSIRRIISVLKIIILI
ncbi:MAG: hypothetical protein RLZZ210_22 [Pseudomonadota bacterium]|jgi:hypothetical protein